MNNDLNFVVSPATKRANDAYLARGASRPMTEPLPLPLTIPVQSIVSMALQRLEELEGLDRDEAYLLARLNSVPEDERTAALKQAIEDAPAL